MKTNSYYSAVHKNIQRVKSLTGDNFMSNVVTIENYKTRAKKLLPQLPKENGFTFIPNRFLDDLLKEDFSVEQLNEILSIFKQEVVNG
uniref:Uncharacterized protein n=1 Tax=Arsenophonus endosymbiont of Trialeurodes vaporariorum TaxID=235567 RepID=A0A3B0MC83_9GAMM